MGPRPDRRGPGTPRAVGPAPAGRPRVRALGGREPRGRRRDGRRPDRGGGQPGRQVRRASVQGSEDGADRLRHPRPGQLRRRAVVPPGRRRREDHHARAEDRHLDLPRDGVLRDLPRPDVDVPAGGRAARLLLPPRHQRGVPAVRSVRSLVPSIVFVLILVALSATGFLAWGLAPQLGLDLVGGVSVVLTAPTGTPSPVIDRALETIRERVDRLGVAEPDITRQGELNIQVQIPRASGRSQQRLLELLGRTARLEFREVLETVPPGSEQYEGTKITPGSPENEEVVFADANRPEGQDPTLYRLSEVLLTGDAITEARASFQDPVSTQPGDTPGWRVDFELNSEGSDRFGEIATERPVAHHRGNRGDHRRLHRAGGPRPRGGPPDRGPAGGARAVRGPDGQRHPRARVAAAGDPGRGGRADPPEPLPGLLLSAARRGDVAGDGHLGPVRADPDRHPGEDRRIQPHAGRRGRRDRVAGHRRGLVHRVLRAAQGRGAEGEDPALRGGARVRQRLADHPRRQHRDDRGRGDPLSAGDRLRQRLRADAGTVDAARPVRGVVLQAAHRIPHRPEPTAVGAPGDGTPERRGPGGGPGAGGRGEPMRVREAIATFRGQREFHLNIIGRRRWWFALSGVVLALALIGLIVGGLNLSIAFRGGAVLEYPNTAGVAIQDVQETMASFGRDDAVVQLIDGREVNVRTGTLGGQRTAILRALADQAGIRPDEINIEEIGPQWGEQISRQALIAFLISIALVVLYISFRFEWKMAVAGLAALFHDLVITAGIYALAGREVTPETVIAILTILGYSLYDTVVIFDKIRENTESPALVARETYAGAVNITMNQVVMRSVNTSLTTLVPIAALLFFGVDILKDFAFALLVGVAASSYSSIFTAAPLLVVLKEREPKMTEIRQRALRRETARPALAAEPDETEQRELAPVATRPAPRPQQVRRKPKKKPRSKRKRR